MPSRVISKRLQRVLTLADRVCEPAWILVYLALPHSKSGFEDASEYELGR